MRILVSGYYGFGNIGDEAILAATVSLLRKRWGGVDICVLSANPAYTARAYDVEAAHRWKLPVIWSELKRADLLISGGGGLLQDTTSMISPLYYLGVLRLARMARTPYVIFAQGLGPLRHALVRSQAARQLSRAAAITLRDDASLDLARAIGVKGDIEVTADPAMLLEPAPAPRAQELLTRAGVSPTKPLVGVTLRAWPQIEAVIAKVTPLIKRAGEEWGAEVVLIPFQPPDDVSLAWRLASESGASVKILEGIEDPRDYVGIVSRLKLLVSMRLHGLIFAAAQAVPAIGLAYDPKLIAFARQARQPVFGIGELSADELLETAREALQSREATATQREQTAGQLRREALRNFEVLEDVLSSWPQRKAATAT